MIAAATVTSAAISDGAEDDVEIGRREELGVGRERRLVDDQAGELVEAEEALREQRQQRADIDDAEPEERRAEQEREKQPRMAEEHVGERGGAGRRARARRRRRSRPRRSCRLQRCERARPPGQRHPLARLAGELGRRHGDADRASPSTSTLTRVTAP